MRMRVSYLDCHEARLYCYLVIHIENLLHPLQMFYFHLWSIYWLSLVSHLVCIAMLRHIKYIIPHGLYCGNQTIFLTLQRRRTFNS
jgi:hypothetical protein